MARIEAAAAGLIGVTIVALVVFLAVNGVGGSDTPPPSRTSESVSPDGTPLPEETPPPATSGGELPTRLAWQGSDWFLQGVNLPWYSYGCDFGCGAEEGVSSGETQTALRQAFANLQEAGVHVVRWWTFPGELEQITLDESGLPSGLKAVVYEDFDAAMALAEEYDLYYVFTLFSSPTDLPRQWLNDPEGRGALVTALTPLFTRYATNPRLLTWQVFNEPEWHIWNGEVTAAALQATVKAIAEAVHANSQAMVSVGSAHLGGLSYWRNLGLDYYTAHWYDSMSEGEACARCLDFSEIRDVYLLDKPLIIGEFYAGTEVDAMQRYEDWYNNGFAGALAWSLFADRTLDELDVDLRSAADFAAAHADTGPAIAPPAGG